MVKAVTRRGRGRARVVPASAPPEETGPEAARERLFNAVLRAAEEELCTIEDPLAAEVWGSRLLDLTGGVEELDALVERAGAEPRGPALALLLVLAAVGPAPLARRARAAATRQVSLGVPPPRWAEVIGRAGATEAWSGSDVFGDQEVLVVGFAYPDGAEHTISVLIDHGHGGGAVDAHPTGPLAEVLPAWWASEGIAMRPVSLTEAAVRLTRSLATTDAAAGRPVRLGLAVMRALLAARLGAMPTRRRGPTPDDDPEDEAKALVAEFLASPEAAALPNGDGVARLCAQLVDSRRSQGDGQPLRWSPALVAQGLLEFLPARLAGDPSAALLPEVLAAWVRWAGIRRGLPDEAVARTAATVAECRAAFLLATGAAPG